MAIGGASFMSRLGADLHRLSMFFFLANWKSFSAAGDDAVAASMASSGGHCELLGRVLIGPGRDLGGVTLAAIPTVALSVIFPRTIVSSYKMAGLKIRSVVALAALNAARLRPLWRAGARVSIGNCERSRSWKTSWAIVDAWRWL